MTVGAEASPRRWWPAGRVIVLGLAIVVAVAFYTFVSYLVGANSDNMSSLLVARDMATGNFWLKGWSLSTQPFIFTDTIWAALAIGIFGYDPLIVHVVPALMYVATGALCILLVRAANPGGIILLLPLFLVPTVSTALVGLEFTVHGGAVLIATGSLVLLERASSRQLLWSALPLALLWGLAASSDALFVYIFVFPAIIAGLVQGFAGRRRYLMVAGAAVLSLPLHSLFAAGVLHLFEFSLPGLGSPGLASIDGIVANIGFFLTGIGYYFAIDFGRGPLPAVLSAARLLLAVAMVAAFVVVALRVWRRSYVDSFLVAATIVPSAAFIFSTVALDAYSSRYFYFALVTLTVLVARNVALGRFRTAAWLVLLPLALLNAEAYPGRWPPEQARHAELSRFLAENGLRKGYAGYWHASVTSAMGPVHVAPVMSAGSIRPFHWLSKARWYRDRRTFFLAADAAETALAVAQFGPPLRELHFQNLTVLVWDRISFRPRSLVVPDLAGGGVHLGAGDVTGDGVATRGEDGFLMWGPYAPLRKGRYRVELEGTLESGEAALELYSMGGDVSILQPIAFDAAGRMRFDVVMPRRVDDLEVRVYVTPDDRLTIRRYSIAPAGAS